MAQNSYNWVPDELVESANRISDWLVHRGFSVKVEKTQPGFPHPPTFLATRGSAEREVVEVVSRWRPERMKNWIAYAKGCQRELKVSIAIASEMELSKAAQKQVRRLGIGLIRVTRNGAIREIEPVDAAIVVSIPVRQALHSESKPLLGPAYDHFDGHRWREGFDEACKALETSAKKYLKKWIKTGRLRFVGRNGPVTYTDAKINRFTMGGLEKAFEQIQAQNASDRVIRQALKSIRKDRNKITHNKWSGRTEGTLRRNVSQHMWVITQALEETHK